MLISYEKTGHSSDEIIDKEKNENDNLFFSSFYFFKHLYCDGWLQAGYRLGDALPASNQHKDWRVSGSIQKAEGNQLFMMINGGATLYLSLGFKRALTASFTDKHGKPINLDIFEMNSPTIAQRVNQEKVGTEAKKLAFGNDTSLESYYLNFWQGPYQITISGYGSNKESIDSIVRLAKIVDGKIVSSLTVE